MHILYLFTENFLDDVFTFCSNHKNRTDQMLKVVESVVKKNHMEDLARIFSLEEVDVLFKSVDEFGHEGRLHVLFQYRFYSRRCVMLRWHPNQTWSGVKRSRWEIKL